MPIGFGGVLFIVFLVLKLTHLIAWSWWWVTSPLWIGAVLTVLMVVIFGSVFALFAGRTAKGGSRR